MQRFVFCDDGAQQSPSQQQRSPSQQQQRSPPQQQRSQRNVANERIFGRRGGDETAWERQNLGMRHFAAEPGAGSAVDPRALLSGVQRTGGGGGGGGGGGDGSAGGYPSWANNAVSLGGPELFQQDGRVPTHMSPSERRRREHLPALLRAQAQAQARRNGGAGAVESPADDDMRGRVRGRRTRDCEHFVALDAISAEAPGWFDEQSAALAQ